MTVDPRAPKAPAHLSAASRRWFGHVVAEFNLEPQHVRLLQLAAEAWDEGEEARKLLARAGLVVTDRFGQERAHPAVAIRRDSRIAFARLVRELALEDSPPGARPPRIGGR